MPVDDPTGSVLDIRGLSVDFATPRGPVHAVRGVDLAIAANKTVGIVGESGCGKSTVALAAMRLLASNARVTQGEIRLGGRDLLSMPPSTLRSVRGRYASMVFQDPMTAQNPVLSIARQMIDIQYRDTALSLKEKRRRAVEMLGRVGIPDAERRIDNFPHQFSGGMRQRISIAMTLLVRPQLVIADEPTTALDVNTEAQIVFLLRRLQRETGISLLFVSHNLGLIAELCDEVVVMYAGEIVEQAATASLFHTPKHPYTQKLLECDPALALKRTRRLATIPGRVPDLRRRPPGCVFAERCHMAFEPCEGEPPRVQRLGPAHTARCHLLTHPLPRPAQASSPRSISEEKEEDAAERIDGVLLDIANLGVRFRTEGPVQALLRGRRDPFLDAVVNVSLQLRRGETLGLVGESGSGKTTLGRTIAGLVRPQRGAIRFDDTGLVGLSRAQYNLQRRKLAMIFQDPVASLSPRQTARALVMEPFEVHRVPLTNPRAKAEELFSMVGLSAAFFQRYPHELSGGQARRVSVARALALAPKLIIADEPTAGLDVSVQGEILNLLGDLQRQAGLSYLIISHNLPAIRHISDRIGVMYLGRLVEQAPTDELFAAPAHPYTRALLEGIPQPDPDRRRNTLPVEGEVPSLTERPGGCEFHPRCPFATDRCRSEMPHDRRIGPYRSVRCHYPLTNTLATELSRRAR